MAQKPAKLPKGNRITDYVSLGVDGNTFPVRRVKTVLVSKEKGNIRRRDFPADVAFYCLIMLAFHMQSSYREVLRCLLKGVQLLLNLEVCAPHYQPITSVNDP